MTRFEYEISRHPAEIFNELVIFCTADGTCSLDQVPPDQPEILKNILNERGSEGWELVQVLFGRQGFMAIWKRPLV
ncbi:MAG: hypothetical protein A2521_00630 [Deltaproteobacteria bacterium RIFOXYD12_FULL_57_12]|nr:MAG: hypothetical protein A2521_00630 [Deltaproteobacteria bacterium RIFOXYD12_FULL_57_12]